MIVDQGENGVECSLSDVNEEDLFFLVTFKWAHILKMIRTNSQASNGSSVSFDGGTDNPNYIRSGSDHHLSGTNEEGSTAPRIPPRGASASAASFPVIYEVASDGSDPSKSEISFAPRASASSAALAQQQRRQSGAAGPHERQLSILDPMSDRVSTILVWQNLSVQAREKRTTEFFEKLKSYKNFVPKRKCLLSNSTGAITGGLWAVMGKWRLFFPAFARMGFYRLVGPSGSGKSTLLNTLACRLDVNTIVEGEMRLNGAPYDNAELKRIAGYVMQSDLLNGYLTVEETLMYTARLRLPRSFTDKERRERVHDVMGDLGLSHVHNVIVGTPLKKGISGGERKRVCVGLQLLNRPQLLFLDEPTSGLDSVTALDLLRTFHALAHGKSQEKAVTIVCSIHQPQAKIFNLFDSLILLKAGTILFQGPRKQAMVRPVHCFFVHHRPSWSAFQEVYRIAGFPCPVHANPADHLLDVITPPRSNHLLGTATVSLEQQQAIDEAIMKAQSESDVDLNMGVNKRLVQMANLPVNPSWPKQVQILFGRSMQEQLRQSRIFITSMIQTVIMAILIGTVFLNIGTGQKSVVRREPSLFFCAVNQGIFGALMVINSFPVERALSLRERASGSYCASSYFIAKILAETLVQLPVPIIFVSLTAFPFRDHWRMDFYICFIVLHSLLSDWISTDGWQILHFHAVHVSLFSGIHIISPAGLSYL